MNKFDKLVDKYNIFLENQEEASTERIDPSRVSIEIQVGNYRSDVGERLEDGTITKGKLTELERDMVFIFQDKFTEARKTTPKTPNQENKVKPQWMIDQEKYAQMAQEIQGEQPEQTQQEEQPQETTNEEKLDVVRNKAINSYKFEFKHRTKKLQIIKKNQSMVNLLAKEANIKKPDSISFPLYGVEIFENPSIHLLLTKVPSKETGKEIIIWLRAFSSYREYYNFTTMLRSS